MQAVQYIRDRTYSAIPAEATKTSIFPSAVVTWNGSASRREGVGGRADLVDGILDRAVVTHVHLLEDDGDVVFLGQHGDRFVAVLFEHVEDGQSPQVHVAEGLGNIEAQSTGTTTSC